MLTATKKMTVDEFQAYAAGAGRCELIDGEVHEMSPAGYRHGILAGRFFGEIYSFVSSRDLGEVVAAETGFVLDPPRHTVRAPDVAFTRRERATDSYSRKFARIMPDLCVEVLSPDDRAGEVNSKTRAWLKAGVKAVWVADDDSRTVTVHEPGGRSRTFQENETLPGGEVLPDFELPLAKLFA